jgi:hypothetical protein
MKKISTVEIERIQIFKEDQLTIGVAPDPTSRDRFLLAVPASGHPADHLFGYSPRSRTRSVDSVRHAS